MKRRARGSTRPPPSRPCAKDSSAPPRSHFLGLPAELRDHVYGFAAGDYRAVLRSSPRGRLVSNSPLMRVSKQIRDEYSSALYLAAPIVTALVRDMDFSHVVTFLNKLSDRELNALPNANLLSDRHVVIELELTHTCPSNPEALQRWLNRFEHPTKKGTKIEVAYIAYGKRVYTPPEWYNKRTTNPMDPTLYLYQRDQLGAIPHPSTPVGEALRAQRKVLMRMEKFGVQGRVYEELKKVVAALQIAGPQRLQQR
jgi:hypothetical protein